MTVTRTAAEQIESIVDAWHPQLMQLDAHTAHQKPSEERRSVSEVIGHLVDSACNNHQRFVRAQKFDELTFPKYDQNAWIAAANYRLVEWADLVTL